MQAGSTELFSISAKIETPRESSGGSNGRLSDESSCLSSALADKIFDVFLVHTGRNKKFVAKPLKKILEEQQSADSGETICSNRERTPLLRCFLDIDMKNYNGYARRQMESAIETCRYAVVILTQAFLEQKHPRAELKYAFQRDQMLSQMYHWHSLYIILFDLTVEDYQRHCDANPEQGLPDIKTKQVLFLFNDVYESQEALFEAVKEAILESDRRGAKQYWESFLVARVLHGNLHGLSARGMYDRGEEEPQNETEEVFEGEMWC